MKKFIFVITALLLCLSGYSQKFVRIEEKNIFVKVLNVSHKHINDYGDKMVVVESTDRKLYIVPKRLVLDGFWVAALYGDAQLVKGSTLLENYFMKYEYNNETITKLQPNSGKRKSGALYLASDIGIILSAGILPMATCVFEPVAIIVPAALIGITALTLRINGDVKLMKNE